MMDGIGMAECRRIACSPIWVIDYLLLDELALTHHTRFYYVHTYLSSINLLHMDNYDLIIIFMVIYIQFGCFNFFFIFSLIIFLLTKFQFWSNLRHIHCHTVTHSHIASSSSSWFLFRFNVNLFLFLIYSQYLCN